MLLAVLAIWIAPGTWVRTIVPPPDFTAPLLITPLANPQGLTSVEEGEITLLRAWKLDSRNAHFGGYSALVTLPKGRLLAGSDRGRLLEMPLPENADPKTPVQFSYFAGTTGGPRIFVDLEALERDEAAKTIWGAYEYKGRIESFSRGQIAKPARGAAIPAMKDWPDNGGAETMVRLADGRFVVIAEASSSKSRTGLLFSGDPIAHPKPKQFRFMPPEGYSPVDGTLLPDGRVMLLVRRVIWGLPPRFATGLVVADPAEINEGGMWRGEMIATIAGPDLDENFEGIANIPQNDGSLDLYLIADDNLSAFQETLMLRLNWKPKSAPKSAPDSKKAR
ncbi:MAG: esterase-like activity of phytase family protein [Erythrobacter sp.]